MPIITDQTITNRWKNFYGKKAVSSFQLLNKAGINSFIRINYLKTTDEELIPILEKKGFEFEPSSLHGAYKVRKHRISLGATNEFLLGYYAIQGLASQHVSHVVSPSKNDHVLDMSAAPGGKTAHLATLMNNEGLITATDSSKTRMTAFRSNLARLHVTNVLGIQGDAVEILSNLGLFDKILLDAPCTGSGSICKRPTMSWTKTLADVERLADKQFTMFETGIRHLKIGGEITFSTCSIEPEEGELQILRMLRKYKESLELIDISDMNEPFIPSIIHFDQANKEELSTNQKQWLRILPEKDYEGFFIAKLRKIASLKGGTGE